MMFEGCQQGSYLLAHLVDKPTSTLQTILRMTLSSGDLHYSSIMCLSQGAVEKIRNLLLQTIEETESLIKKALNETVYALTLDLFKIQ